MSINRKLIDLLCCPVRRVPLKLANAAQTTALRAAAGNLLYVDGTAISSDFNQALITADAGTAYLVIDDIPDLLPEHGINLRALPSFPS